MIKKKHKYSKQRVFSKNKQIVSTKNLLTVVGIFLFVGLCIIVKYVSVLSNQNQKRDAQPQTNADNYYVNKESATTPWATGSESVKFYFMNETGLFKYNFGKISTIQNTHYQHLAYDYDPKLDLLIYAINPKKDDEDQTSKIIYMFGDADPVTVYTQQYVQFGNLVSGILDVKIVSAEELCITTNSSVFLFNIPSKTTKIVLKKEKAIMAGDDYVYVNPRLSPSKDKLIIDHGYFEGGSTWVVNLSDSVEKSLGGYIVLGWKDNTTVVASTSEEGGFNVKYYLVNVETLQKSRILTNVKDANGGLLYNGFLLYCVSKDSACFGYDLVKKQTAPISISLAAKLIQVSGNNNEDRIVYQGQNGVYVTDSDVFHSTQRTKVVENGFL